MRENNRIMSEKRAGIKISQCYNCELVFFNKSNKNFYKQKILDIDFFKVT